MEYSLLSDLLPCVPEWLRSARQCRQRLTVMEFVEFQVTSDNTFKRRLRRLYRRAVSRYVMFKALSHPHVRRSITKKQNPDVDVSLGGTHALVIGQTPTGSQDKSISLHVRP
jgi:hypothetical protein